MKRGDSVRPLIKYEGEIIPFIQYYCFNSKEEEDDISVFIGIEIKYKKIQGIFRSINVDKFIYSKEILSEKYSKKYFFEDLETE